MRREETFVVIVGGGPVGLSAAVELGWRNVPAILVSENLETATHPRCNFTNARTMEHFRRLGLAADVRSAAPLAGTPPYVAYVTRFCGHELGRISLNAARGGTGDAGPALVSFESGVNISQLFLEPILKQHAERQSSVDIRFGWRARALHERDGHVIAEVENLQSGECVEIEASYLIAADGARSLGRREIGAVLQGEDGHIGEAFVSGAMMTFFIRAPTLLAESGRAPSILTWIINREIRAFVFAQDGRERWIIHYQVPEGTPWQEVDQKAVLRAIFGREIPYEIINSGPWTGGLALIADHYQSRRILLAGDAAHLFTPLGGFGMNTGIGDAVNLGWKLQAVYEGWGGQALLQSYECERRPIGFRNSRLGVQCSRRKGRWSIPSLIEDDGEAADIARRDFGDFVVADDLEEYATVGLQLGEIYEGSPIIVPDGTAAPEDRWNQYVPVDRPGARAPDFRVDAQRSFHDHVGRGFLLADFGCGASSEPFLAAARERGMPISLASLTPPPGLYSSKLVLVRPDQHLAWHGARCPDDPIAVIDRVRGAGP